MTNEELLRVRALIAESRAAAASRHAEFMAQYGDMMLQIAQFWQSHVPDGVTIALSPDLSQKLEEFRERWKDG